MPYRRECGGCIAYGMRVPVPYLSLYGGEFAEAAADIAEIAFDAGGVAEEEARHEAKDHVVDLAVFGDADDAAFRVGGDVKGPRAPEGKVPVGDADHTAAWHLVFDELEGDLLA